MKITKETLVFFNEQGLSHIRQCIIDGLKEELQLYGGDNGDFDAVCELYLDLEAQPHSLSVLAKVIDELNDCDSEDMFGTEGWEFEFEL
jgi:hypothetical protein